MPKGLLREPGSITKALWFLQSNVIMLLPFWALAVMGTLWWKFGRDPDPGISVAPLYEPPKGMTPAEVGTLVDDSLDPRDISSTLIDLAVKGYVKIEETEVKALLFTHKDYVFHLLKPRDQWSSLAAHELTMLTNVFADGDLCLLSYLTNRFYTSIPVIKNNVFSSLRSRGLYAGSSLSAPVYVLLGVVVIVAPFLLFALVSGPAALFSSPLLVLICGGLALLAVVLVGRRLGFTKTREGARTLVAILGFQEFMNRVDADRLKQMPPDTFEKYLPYAMALGVEHHWARAFEGLITQPPTWYVSPNPMNIFSPTYFSNSMSSMAGEIHDVFTSAPRSDSSGSGFSAGGGGGFSGGGASGKW